MATVIWARAAREQFDEAVAYIASNSPRAASLLTHRILDAINQLSVFPQSGRVVPELGQQAIREIIVAPYRILYRHEGDLVEVIAVHHGARSLRQSDIDSGP